MKDGDKSILAIFPCVKGSEPKADRGKGDIDVKGTHNVESILIQLYVIMLNQSWFNVVSIVCLLGIIHVSTISSVSIS